MSNLDTVRHLGFDRK